jgi:hypothetical protein
MRQIDEKGAPSIVPQKKVGSNLVIPATPPLPLRMAA